jgi:hypothetical protein
VFPAETPFVVTKGVRSLINVVRTVPMPQ